ncbi:hypothetical protein BGZ95_012111 [Linnemannia exigua]|uniref:Uncharacterized protein n=1 Tax=Linnemannia exigua TaxID=604196 RepID=A0AAD4D975_9FUNG|nr:hypothetical protein BGZ95_012111 [Linnemannia exigua]
MKPTFSALALASLACLQFLAGTTNAQAATTTTTTTAAATAPGATGTPAPIVPPTPPTFVNTPGLQVPSIYDGMSVMQGSFLTISTKLQDGRAMGSIVLTVAKKDGSGNTTIATVNHDSPVSSSLLWDASAAKFPAGPYVLNLVVTPNTTTGATNPPTVPAPPPTAVAGPSVFYWRATVNVVVPRAPSPISGAVTGRGNIGSTVGYVVAAGVALLGSFLVL